MTRRFHLLRDHDVSGISGTGHIADGVLWDNGTVTICWRGPHESVVHRRSVRSVEEIECHGGATRIVWDDGEPDDVTLEQSGGTIAWRVFGKTADELRHVDLSTAQALAHIARSRLDGDGLTPTIMGAIFREALGILEERIAALTAAADLRAVLRADADRLAADPTYRELLAESRERIAAAFDVPYDIFGARPLDAHRDVEDLKARIGLIISRQCGATYGTAPAVDDVLRLLEDEDRLKPPGTPLLDPQTVSDFLSTVRGLIRERDAARAQVAQYQAETTIHPEPTQ